MKSFVITIKKHEKSVKAAQRCISSAFPLKVEMFDAITPQDDPVKLFKEKGITDKFFKEVGSRRLNCMAAFLSHHTLWEQCIADKEDYLIFEHDAVVVGDIPDFLLYDGCVSLGAPSYGKFNTPSMLGVNTLVSKKYFPGAHAYRIKPSAAKVLVNTAKTQALPTDIFLDIRRFSFLQEYYPWPVIARDSFTTIQNDLGCKAKHNYGKEYEILNIN